jgi:class 3 adenylate cyclase
MAERPTGTVTLLFTDIEGSTRLLHSLGERYEQVLADHRRLLRETFAAHGGHEVDTQGDAFFVAFSGVKDSSTGYLGGVDREVDPGLTFEEAVQFGLDIAADRWALVGMDS